jgi:hypothetical protein
LSKGKCLVFHTRGQENTNSQKQKFPVLRSGDSMALKTTTLSLEMTVVMALGLKIMSFGIILLMDLERKTMSLEVIVAMALE